MRIVTQTFHSNVERVVQSSSSCYFRFFPGKPNNNPLRCEGRPFVERHETLRHSSRLYQPHWPSPANELDRKLTFSCPKFPAQSDASTMFSMTRSDLFFNNIKWDKNCVNQILSNLERFVHSVRETVSCCLDYAC